MKSKSENSKNDPNGSILNLKDFFELIGFNYRFTFYDAVYRSFYSKHTKLYIYEYRLRLISVLIYLVYDILLCFAIDYDFALINAIKHTNCFLIGYGSRFPKAFGLCYVLNLIFGTMMIYFRYTMLLDPLSSQLVKEIGFHGTDFKSIKMLKHCDPTTLKHIEFIINIANFIASYGPLFFSSVLLFFFILNLYSILIIILIIFSLRFCRSDLCFHLDGFICESTRKLFYFNHRYYNIYFLVPHFPVYGHCSLLSLCFHLRWFKIYARSFRLLLSSLG